MAPRDIYIPLTIYGILGMAGILVVSFSQSSISCGEVIGGGLLLFLSAWATGALMGFVFGVPRSTANSQGDDDGGDFKTNTNLEEVSDWLTKILLGAGLTQLVTFPGFLKKAVEYLALDLPFDGVKIFIPTLLFYGFVGGFLTAFLTASTLIAVALSRAARAMLEEAMRENVEGIKQEMRNDVSVLQASLKEIETKLPTS